MLREIKISILNAKCKTEKILKADSVPRNRS